MITIALDAMGGDNAPESNVLGALKGLEEHKDLRILLFGQEEAVKPFLEGKSYDAERLELIPCSEVISPEEQPVDSIRRKKDSSIVQGLRAVKDGKASAFISAGSTGAVLAGGQLLVGRLKGVLRSPLAYMVPTGRGASLLLDCGANVDAKPEWLAQYAVMGSEYMKRVAGIENPTVGLLNLGTEEEKGSELVKEARKQILALPGINFTGYIESSAIPQGGADVIVTDAFTGNACLKLYEGTAKMIKNLLKSTFLSGAKTKLGALLVYPELKRRMKLFDASEHGGAPLLGLRGLVVKCHGNSGAKEIGIAIGQCLQYRTSDLSSVLQDAFSGTEGEKQA